MIEVFEDCSSGKYRKAVVASAKATKKSALNDEKPANLEFRDGLPVIKGLVTETTDGTIVLEKVRNDFTSFFQSGFDFTDFFNSGPDCHSKLRHCRTKFIIESCPRHAPLDQRTQRLWQELLVQDHLRTLANL